MNEEHNIIKIQMFGNFSMTAQGTVLDEEKIWSTMLTRLISYFLCCRTREIPSQELIDVLWGETESENPTGALKNLIYRLRTLLKRTWPEYDFIITGRGTYRLNENLPLVLDTEEFEAYCGKAAEVKEQEEKIRLLMKAAELYKGMFLPNITGEYWALSLSTYYHSMYLSAVKELAGLLEDAERFEEMSRICSLALKLEPLDEDLYCLSVQALVRQNKLYLAREQYRKAVDTLYENLGISPSQNLRKVYEDILRQTHEEELSIQVIKEEMDEDDNEGAFYCEYGVFKKLYQLEKRRAERLGISEYLVLVTVTPRQEIKTDSQAYLDILGEAMQTLRTVLLNSLRAGDVITKYSGSQYLILLPTCQYETAKIVVHRIEAGFLNLNKKRVSLQFGLEEMGFLDLSK